MIKSFEIDNLMLHKHLSFEAKGINVFIGENDTGKTTILKALYALLKSAEEDTKSERKEDIEFRLRNKITNTFFPKSEGLRSLYKNFVEPFFIKINIQDEEYYILSYKFLNNFISIHPFPDSFNKEILFIPAKEVLSTLRTIALSREQYELLEFDDTYYD